SEYVDLVRAAEMKNPRVVRHLRGLAPADSDKSRDLMVGSSTGQPSRIHLTAPRGNLWPRTHEPRGTARDPTYPLRRRRRDHAAVRAVRLHGRRARASAVPAGHDERVADGLGFSDGQVTHCPGR